MDSLLVNLRKYRPRENTDPIENFITEAFAFLLKDVSEASSCFLTFINSRLTDKAPNLGFEHTTEVVWSTQENFNGKYPDMFANCGQTKVVFEHKVWSNLHNRQLENYRDYAEQYYSDYRLVLITGHEKQHEQEPDIALCWRDVFSALAPLLQKLDEETKAHWLLSEFLNLLKMEGLGPNAPISQNAIWHYIEAKQLEDQLHGIMSKFKNKTWQGMERFESTVQRISGRLGLEFKTTEQQAFQPRLFIGALLDPTDHRVNHRSKKGINLVCIISFDKVIHKHYGELQSFNKLPDELITNCKLSDRNIWQFYHHAKDNTATAQNPHHPFYLEVPLIDILSGSESLEDQEAILGQAFQDALRIVTSCTAFGHLLDELEIIRNKANLS